MARNILLIQDDPSDAKVVREALINSRGEFFKSPAIAPRNAALPQDTKCETGSMQKQRSMNSLAKSDRSDLA